MLQMTTLKDRALIAVSGADWRPFLQGLLTQDVETLVPGELRFGALLTPQGRLLFDLFLLGQEHGCWIEVDEARRDDLMQRLTMYRLRAKVTFEPLAGPVHVIFPGPLVPAPAFACDPRDARLGLRGYGLEPPMAVEASDLAAFEALRLRLGIPGPADFAQDGLYPIEANLDLLNGIDFSKGCFVGQETTSRMKRRGQIKTRMLGLTFDGPAPAFGTEVLNGELRAGQVLSGQGERAIGLMRLDRLDGDLNAGDRRAVVAGAP